MRSFKRLLRALLPPLFWNGLKAVKTRVLVSDDRFFLAREGWSTKLPTGLPDQGYWERYTARERLAYQQIVHRYDAGELVFTVELEEHLKHVTFAYVLALAADQRHALSVLDYGSNLGEDYWVGRALVPGVALEYHCKELPALVRVGREINPAVTWHIDDRCLDRRYDLVMLLNSLPYLANWQDIIRAAARASGRYLYLSTPSVREVAAYVAAHRTGGATTLYQVLNRTELVDTVERTGLRLVREFAMGPHLHIERAPQQPVYAGWLFERPAPGA